MLEKIKACLNVPYQHNTVLGPNYLKLFNMKINRNDFANYYQIQKEKLIKNSQVLRNRKYKFLSLPM